MQMTTSYTFQSRNSVKSYIWNLNSACNHKLLITSLLLYHYVIFSKHQRMHCFPLVAVLVAGTISIYPIYKLCLQPPTSRGVQRSPDPFDVNSELL